jgi:hypothetical protein
MSQMLKQEARSKKQEARSKKQEARSKKQEARSKIFAIVPISHSLTLPLSPAPDFCWVFQTNISW